jgi:hypothetical protein
MLSNLHGQSLVARQHQFKRDPATPPAEASVEPYITQRPLRCTPDESPCSTRRGIGKLFDEKARSIT